MEGRKESHARVNIKGQRVIAPTFSRAAVYIEEYLAIAEPFHRATPPLLSLRNLTGTHSGIVAITASNLNTFPDHAVCHYWEIVHSGENLHQRNL
jgi:hypothetical protein